VLGPINGVPSSPAEREPLVVVGTVYDQNCQPVPNLTFNVWQTDSDGVYGPPSDNANEIRCCYFGAAVTTDALGRYVLHTVRPAVYRGVASAPPAHIHVESEGASAAGLLRAEIVFAGDSRLVNPEDYTNPPPITLEQVTDAKQETLLGVADLRLPGALPTAVPVKESAGADATEARVFTIVPGESSASYQIRERFAKIAGMVSPVATTRDVEGEMRLDLGSPPALESLTVQVGLTGLNSGEPLRDEKLYDDWLVTRDYPTATFTATGVKNAPTGFSEGRAETFILTGDLTIRDITRPVDFTISAMIEGDTITGQGEAQILLTDYGIEPPNLLGFVQVENDVVIKVNITAVEEQGT
jgi:polyisoprenoid-binding protein YceI